MSVQPRPGVANRALCAAVSTASHESLTATASRIDNWIVSSTGRSGTATCSARAASHPEPRRTCAEQPARACSRALSSSVISSAAPTYKCRVRLLHRRRRGTSASSSSRSTTRRTPPGFDSPGLLAGDGPPGMPANHPLLVVCTHVASGIAAARRTGGRFHDALRHETESSWVRQSTHVGGDRFAGNVVMLPQGLYYGRVSPSLATWRSLEARASGRIDMEHYCGRRPQLPRAGRRARDPRVGGSPRRDRRPRASSRPTRSTTAGVSGLCTRDAVVLEADVVSDSRRSLVFLTCGAAEPARTSLPARRAFSAS